ncbi:hypothetical protein DVH05_016018 [Phytophthora capsici]|nr:hypothetical protein DVH05_016018 [Phytophthora capsici]
MSCLGAKLSVLVQCCSGCHDAAQPDPGPEPCADNFKITRNYQIPVLCRPHHRWHSELQVVVQRVYMYRVCRNLDHELPRPALRTRHMAPRQNDRDADRWSRLDL